jgi:hypothetical protein
MQDGARLALESENKRKPDDQNRSYPSEWKFSSWHESVQGKPVSAEEGSLGSSLRLEEGEADRPARLFIFSTLKEPLQGTAASEKEENSESGSQSEEKAERPARMFNMRKESLQGIAVSEEEDGSRLSSQSADGEGSEIDMDDVEIYEETFGDSESVSGSTPSCD